MIYLFGTYGLVFGLLALYLLGLGRRIDRLEADVQRLRNPGTAAGAASDQSLGEG